MTTPPRIRQVRRLLGAKGLDAILVTALKNVRYLSGFTGSAGFLLLTRKASVFVTDFRYQEQAAHEVNGAEILIEKGKRVSFLRRLLRQHTVRTLGFESSISYAFYEHLNSFGLELKPLRNVFEKMRAVKDIEEIAAIERAALRAEQAFRVIRPWIRSGMRESAVSRRLEAALKQQGCRSIPFEIIVASGPNSSMPHAHPTDRKIEPGDLVIVDWGGEADGYFSDMTRTILVGGGADPKKREIYDIVNRARFEAIRSVRVGKKTQEIDAVARGIIRTAGYGDFFGHSLGHGVGLDVHEYPFVSWARGEKVRNGMVFTVEPGIYLPGVGGVRIEDIVLVKDDTVSILTTLSREAEGGVS
ncbi:MAG TPA: Xaa-Pro peptidase family protein [Dissulfurispiraceae bacterium]|nr:Xaa-Pro peptidase family protein [Dissulfurispiraceae bacterium]